jgi:hypothetical protein
VGTPQVPPYDSNALFFVKKIAAPSDTPTAISEYPIPKIT